MSVATFGTLADRLMENESQNRPVFATRLALALKAKAVSEAALARAIGEPQSTFNSWAQGKTEPRVSQLTAIAKELDCSIDYLVGRVEEMRPGHYVIDLDAEDMVRRRVDPPGGRWAWPLPMRFDVVTAAAYEERREKLFGKKRSKKGDSNG